MKIVRWLGLILLVPYFILLIGAYAFQNKLLFHPDAIPKDYHYELSSQGKEVFIKTDDGETINGLWVKRPGSKYVILYFHGNGGSLNGWQFVANDLKETNCDILIVDYRGYGKSTGSFSESGFYLDAEASYDFLIASGYQPDEIILFGRSLGTGIAMDLATKRKAKALILESPFTSITKVAEENYPFLFPHLLLKYNFNSIAKASQITIPVLILHGDKDKLIPYRHSEELYAAIKSPKKFVLIKGGGHNDLIHFPEHNQAIQSFISGL